VDSDVRKKALDSIVVSGLGGAALGLTLYLYRTITGRFSPTDTDAFFLALGALNVVIGPAYNAISSVFVPALVKRSGAGSGTLAALLGSTIGWTALCSAFLAIAVAALAAEGLRLFGAVLSPATAQLVRQDVILLGPLIATQAVGAVLGAANQAVGRYWIAAAAGVIQQLVTLIAVSTWSIPGSASLPLSFTVGAVSAMLFMIALWPRRELPIRLTLAVPSELGLLGTQAVPIAVGSIAQQTGLVVVRVFASHLTAGAVTAFDLAYRLGVALVEVTSSGVLAVALTEWSGAIASGQGDTLRSRLRDTVALSVFAILPIPILVHALREPVVRLWLPAEAATSGLAAMTTAAMAILLWGVPVDIAGRLYLRALLARGRTATQGVFAGLRMILTVLFSWLLVRPLGLRGLALSEIAALTLTVGGLYRVATDGRGSTEGESRGWSMLGIATAGAACWFVASIIAGSPISSPFVKCLAGSVGGGIVYLLVARILKTRELQMILSAVSPAYRPLREP
jgi:putative peptidoglycan lipid II flippase